MIFTLTSNDESASIVASTDSSQAAAIQYTEVGSMTLQVVVDDGEDTATDTDEYHFCAGGFEGTLMVTPMATPSIMQQIAPPAR